MPLHNYQKWPESKKLTTSNAGEWDAATETNSLMAVMQMVQPLWKAVWQ